jgi:hypothetical protein
VKAAQAAGLEIERVEMSPDGKISIYPARGSPREAPDIGIAKNAADVVAERLR